MKKITLTIMTICLSLSFLPVRSSAASNTATSTVVVSQSADAAQADVLLNRIKEINTMDKTELTSSEKKNLRTEVRSIRHQLSDIGGGIYLSVGAVILIVILLVILL